MVDSLVLSNGRWNVSLLESLFHSNSVKKNLDMFWCNTGLSDKLVWLREKSGIFSVKSVHHLFQQMEDNSCWWNFIWSSAIHDRLKFFIWRLANNGIPTLSWLANRNCDPPDSLCPHGCGVVESSTQLFFKCNVACALWFASLWNVRWDHIVSDNLMDFLIYLMPPNVSRFAHRSDRGNFLPFAALLLNHIWEVRNDLIFEGKSFQLDVSLQSLNRKMREFCVFKDSCLDSLGVSSAPPPVVLLN